MKFELVGQKRKNVLVLVPGWATDGRIFASLKLDYNYLVPGKVNPDGFAESLSRELKRRRLERISLFGCSLGGFLAADFSRKYPHLVEDVFLVGVRRKYPPRTLQGLRKILLDNKAACLRGFYRGCFSSADEGWRWFKERLLPFYLEELSTEYLLSGLDYLFQNEFSPAGISGRKVVFFHGEADKIAPLAEARDVAGELNRARFISFAGAGHLPFLNSSFRSRFYAR